MVQMDQRIRRKKCRGVDLNMSKFHDILEKAKVAKNDEFYTRLDERFEIVVWSLDKGWTAEYERGDKVVDGRHGVFLDGRNAYKRIFIRRKRR